MELLLSTMNKKNIEQQEALLSKMNWNKTALIINQMPESKIAKKEEINKNYRCISTQEIGLSKSRNMAIQNAKEDICLFADDDVILEDQAEQVINQAYHTYLDADIICFFIESLNANRKIKKMKNRKVGFLKTMRIASFQITFKRKKILEKGLQFDEEFGAGSKWDHGEEAIFLCDCLRQGLKIQYIDKKIGKVEQKESTWYKGFTKDFLYKQGAIFYRMLPCWYFFLILQFAIRKKKQYCNFLSCIEAIRIMKKGAQDYKKSKKKCMNRNIT